MNVYDSIERGAAGECEPLRGRRSRTFTLTQLLVACGAVCVCAIGATTVVNTRLANFDEDYPGGAQLGQPEPEQMNFTIDCQADLKKAVAALADVQSKAERVLREMHSSVLPEHDLVGCETVCEGHGYDKDTCDGMTGCHFDEHDQQCFSAVGQEDCDAHELQLNMNTASHSPSPSPSPYGSHSPSPSPYGSHSPSPSPSPYGPHSPIPSPSPNGSHIPIPSPYDHEGDLVGCEKVCEGHGYDKDTCDSMKGCHFDEHDQQCFSAVGQEECDHADQPEEHEHEHEHEPEENASNR